MGNPVVTICFVFSVGVVAQIIFLAVTIFICLLCTPLQRLPKISQREQMILAANMTASNSPSIELRAVCTTSDFYLPAIVAMLSTNANPVVNLLWGLRGDLVLCDSQLVPE